jgi:hypothetical protein
MPFDMKIKFGCIYMHYKTLGKATNTLGKDHTTIFYWQSGLCRVPDTRQSLKPKNPKKYDFFFAGKPGV